MSIHIQRQHQHQHQPNRMRRFKPVRVLSIRLANYRVLCIHTRECASHCATAARCLNIRRAVNYLNSPMNLLLVMTQARIFWMASWTQRATARRCQWHSILKSPQTDDEGKDPGKSRDCDDAYHSKYRVTDLSDRKSCNFQPVVQNIGASEEDCLRCEPV